jgi:hypothetical protein
LVTYNTGDTSFVEDQSELYTNLEEAKEEIWQRWNNETLKKQIENYLKEVPSGFKVEPRAVLYRNIATPNIEFYHFLKLSEEANLNPVVFEYLNDKLVYKSSDKYFLCKIYFYKGKGKNGGKKIIPKRIIDFNSAEGKKFSEIKTVWQEGFIDFHHRILHSCGKGIESIDVSQWSEIKDKAAEQCYQHILSLFVCHGILFETFITNTSEEKFAKKVVLPAFESIVELFGVKPLIVPIVPLDEEVDICWWCYPDYIEKEIPKEWA